MSATTGDGTLAGAAGPDAIAGLARRWCMGGPRLAALRAMIRRVPCDRMVLSLTA
jgi:hypothetical protein